MNDSIQILLFIGILAVLTPLLGSYLVKIYRTVPLVGSLENFCYRIGGINPNKEMNWREYAKALLVFNLLGFLALIAIQLLQGFLPLNPQHFPAVDWASAFNTAVSFTTNTNWQGYAGETTMSYFTQMVGLTTQNFLSASTGIAVLLALIRGFTRKTSHTIGNFWVDLVRSLVYLLIPLSIILSIILVSDGVIQNLSPYVEVTTLEGAKQTIPLGPVASQVAIKQLGTNGGGFFNANSAHPFENPTALTNFLQMIAIILIPASLVYAYGVLIGSKKHGWLILGVMFALWSLGGIVAFYSEYLHNPLLNGYPVLEGKETRFGITNSLLWSLSTSGTSNGSVNAMLASLSPLAGGIALFNIMLGEIIFGGVGVGLCSMIMFILLTVFLSGLMVGRTPEYLGKKIEKLEVQWMVLAILAPGAMILIGSGLSIFGIPNSGPHGLTEILYAFSSTAGNNGSAFAGLNANTDYYNILLGFVMLLGRLSIIIPSLAIAGSLAAKKTTPLSTGTFSTDSLLFAVLLFGVIFLVGGLTFFPALALGPIIEQILMLQGRAF